MSGGKKYARTFKKSAFEKVSVLVTLAILTGVLSGGAIGLVTGHAFSSASTESSSAHHP